MTFDQNNTQGYTDAELDLLNTHWRTIVEIEKLEPETDAWKSRQEKLFRDFDAGDITDEACDYTIRLTGQTPLIVTGHRIANGDTETTNGSRGSRYHVVDVYRSLTGVYCLAVVYRTLWDAETVWETCTLTQNPAEIAERLNEALEETLKHVVGYPATPAYADRQARLLQTLRDRFAVLVSDLCDKIPGAVRTLD